MPPPPPPGDRDPNWEYDRESRPYEESTHNVYRPTDPHHGVGRAGDQPPYAQGQHQAYNSQNVGGYSYGHNEPPKKKNKWLIPLLASLLAFLVLLGLLVWALTRGGDEDPKPTVTAVPPPVVTTQPQSPVVTTPPEDVTTPGSIPGSPRSGANEAGYLAALVLTDNSGVDHGDYWESRVADRRSDVIKLGYSICQAYDEGATPQQIIKAMTDNQIPSTEANWARSAAVVLLCPEHKSSLE